MQKLYKTLIFIFILYAPFLVAQKGSKIYTKEGKLIADTSFSISKTQLKEFLPFEDTLLQQICKKINYPEVELEAQIGDSLIIVSFTINKNDSLKDFKLEKRLEKSDIGIIREIERVLTKYPPTIGTVDSKKTLGKKFLLAFKFNPNASFTGTIIRNGLIIVNYKARKVDSE